MLQPLRCQQPETADHAQLYKVLIDELTDFVVFLMDPEGCIVSWNPGVERVLGYTETEWLSQSADIIFTPEDQEQERSRAEMAKAAQEGCARDVRWHLRKSGEPLYVEGSMVALRDDSGRLLGFSKIMRDITQSKHAEDALRTSESRLRALVEASSDVLYQMNYDWTEMRQLGGGGFIPDTEAPNKEWLSQYIPPDDQPEVLRAIEKAVNTKDVFELEHRVLLTDGSLGWTHSRAVPITGVNGEVLEWFGAATNITQRKSDESERERLMVEYERSNEELSQFASVISHDLKTPIRAIKSYSQLLARHYEGKIDATGKQYLGHIQRSIDAMNQLTETLLSYGKVGQAPPSQQMVCLDTVLENVVHSLRPAIEETGTKIAHQALPTVPGDRSQLEQLLQNLVGNAIKYRRPEQAPRITVSAQSFSTHWKISVRDNGVGIAPQHHQQIFGLLKRLHGAEIEGTGLGLAICKRIVERQGGKIWVESQEGDGATFLFTLLKTKAQN